MSNSTFFYDQRPNYYYNPPTTFDKALPYGIATTLLSVTGTAMSVTATSSAAIITGICLAAIGIYAFISTIICAIKNADNPKQFSKEIDKAIITSAGTAIVSITNQIVSAALDALIEKLIYGGQGNHRIRIYA